MAMSPREWWTQKRQELSASKCEPFMIASAQELTPAQQAVVDGRVVNASEERLARAHKCTEEGVRAGLKAGGIACVASAIPTLLATRYLDWAKRNVNYTGQALIISAFTIAAYFITAEQTILECARSNSFDAIRRGEELKSTTVRTP